MYALTLWTNMFIGTKFELINDEAFLTQNHKSLLECKLFLQMTKEDSKLIERFSIHPWGRTNGWRIDLHLPDNVMTCKE